jgi:hypothetical protein
MKGKVKKIVIKWDFYGDNGEEMKGNLSEII